MKQLIFAGEPFYNSLALMIRTVGWVFKIKCYGEITF